MRVPIRCATFSGMTAAPASCATSASASRRSRNLRNSVSRRSASRERSVRRSSEPALSLLVDELSSLLVDARVEFTMVDEDGGVDDFFVDVGDVGLSPNPLPADRREFLLEFDEENGEDKEARRREGEKHGIMKALIGRTMAVMSVMATTQRNRNATMLIEYDIL